MVILFVLFVMRIIHKQSQLGELHAKKCLIRNGMTLPEVYEILDTDIKPKVDIQLRRDSAYHHTVYFPPLLNSEVPLIIEYKPYTGEVLNYWECDF